jgi:hypothetical protein
MLPSIAVGRYRYISLSLDTESTRFLNGREWPPGEVTAQAGHVTLRIDEI